MRRNRSVRKKILDTPPDLGEHALPDAPEGGET
jgi:hypothetical protein